MNIAAIAICLYILCGTVIVYTFLLYPVAVRILARFKPPLERPASGNLAPSVALIIPVHNGRHFIESKIANALALGYPRDRLDICVIDDGSTDGTWDLLQSLPDRQRITCLRTGGHGGKNEALNQAVAATQGEIIIISDVDALLASSAVADMATWFADDSIGGVCGQKVIADKPGDLTGAQASYLSYQQRIKLDESRIHSITTNEGKLHALRRDCFQPFCNGVTDDLFNLLSVIKAGRRFIYEPSAIAHIPVPAVSPAHELRRRRRIVHRSLRCMRIHGGIRNVPHTGLYRWMLLTQKVIRRLSSLLLATMVLLNFVLAFFYSVFFAVCLLQTLGLAAFLLRLKHPPRDSGSRLYRLADKVFYFALGNLGTLLGLTDFISSKAPPVKWTPQRASSQS